MSRRSNVSLLTALVSLAMAACASASGPAATPTAPGSTATPVSEVVTLLALSQQAAQRVKTDTPDAVLHQIDTDFTKTGFLFTDKAATKEISVLVSALGDPPPSWTIEINTRTPLVGTTDPGLDLPRLKVGPGQVRQAMWAHWPGCSLRILMLYNQDGRLTWLAECTTSAGVVSATMDGETGLFQPSSAPPAQLPVTATPENAVPPVPQPAEAAGLRAALQQIQDQFEIDPTRGCFELLTPYRQYHQGLEQMTVLLLADPRAQALSMADREALFKDVAGFDGARFYAGNGAATLVSLTTNRGYHLGCGSHYAAPDALHVVDRQSGYEATSEITGPAGLVKQVWWAGDHWIVLFKLKLDSTSGPTPWAVWQIAPEGNTWQGAAALEFSPTPYDFDPPPTLRFENGYRTMAADLQYWSADDPCEFNADFKAAYKHDTWQMRRTYQLTGNTYALTSSDVLTFTALRRDTGEVAPINWQDYCAGPVR